MNKLTKISFWLIGTFWVSVVMSVVVIFLSGHFYPGGDNVFYILGAYLALIVALALISAAVGFIRNFKSEKNSWSKPVLSILFSILSAWFLVWMINQLATPFCCSEPIYYPDEFEFVPEVMSTEENSNVKVKKIVFDPQEVTEEGAQNERSIITEIPSLKKIDVNDYESLKEKCFSDGKVYMGNVSMEVDINKLEFMLGRERTDEEIGSEFCTLYDDSYLFDGEKVMISFGFYNPHFSTIESADWETLEVVEWPYSKDKKHIYYYGQIVEGLNPDTYHVQEVDGSEKVGGGVLKFLIDGQKVFFSGKLLEGINAQTMTVDIWTVNLGNDASILRDGDTVLYLHGDCHGNREYKPASELPMPVEVYNGLWC